MAIIEDLSKNIYKNNGISTVGRVPAGGESWKFPVGKP